MATTTSSAPPDTFGALVEGSGQCHIPDAFREQFTHLSAALDWVRVWNSQQAWHLARGGLAAAATAARALAVQCDEYASEAQRLLDLASPTEQA